jgi:uncharacterized membrane protein SirB2
MSPTVYHILHVISLLALYGGTFYAFAAPAETRKATLALTGVASLLMLISGFGLLAKLQLGFPGWVIVKLVCWLGLSALGGIGYRRRGAIGALKGTAFGLAAAAVFMVYARPF